MNGKTEEMYNLEYWNKTIKLETILYSLPKPICIAKKKELLKNPMYKVGTFKITKV